MPIKTFFSEVARAPIPAGIDTTLTLSFRFKIDNVMSQEEFMAFQNEWMEKRNAEQLGKDILIIDSYLNEKGIVAEKTESGMRYVITQPGIGENGKSGQTSKVNYYGYLLDGQYFDSNVKSIVEKNGAVDPMRTYEPYEVTIDQANVIKGWHEALKLMNKGSKATFYMPSTLGYGAQQRSAIILPNSILVFELELIDLK
jgi:FKBP-type peptidyl-prolyl cis-trans isomerase